MKIYFKETKSDKFKEVEFGQFVQIKEKYVKVTRSAVAKFSKNIIIVDGWRICVKRYKTLPGFFKRGRVYPVMNGMIMAFDPVRNETGEPWCNIDKDSNNAKRCFTRIPECSYEDLKDSE